MGGLGGVWGGGVGKEGRSEQEIKSRTFTRGDETTAIGIMIFVCFDVLQFIYIYIYSV